MKSLRKYIRTLITSLLCTFCVLFNIEIFAQNQTKPNAALVKSLKKDYKNATIVSDKGSLAMKLSTAYRDITENDSCKKYATIAIAFTKDFESNNEDLNLIYKKILAKAVENFGASLAFDDATKATDTLEFALRLWKETGDKEGIASTYYSLGAANSFKSQKLVSIAYFERALALFQETNNKKNIANTLLNISLEKRYLGMYGDALEYSIKSLKVAEEIKDTLLMTNCLLSNGFNYMLANNFSEALQEQRKALKLFQLSNNQSGIATSYNDMGTTELQAHNLNAALKYNKIALEIRKKINSANEITISYNYISQIYRLQGLFNEALAAAKQAVPYALKFGDSRFIMDTYLEIGDNYMYLKDYKNAIINYNLAKDVAIKNNSLSYLATIFMQIGKTYGKAGNEKEAIISLKEAVKIVQPIDFKVRHSIYRNLAELYLKNKDYKNAFESQVKFQQTGDSLNALEKAEKITSLTQTLIYENNKALQQASQDKEIALQHSQISKQKLIRNLSIVGLLIGVLLAIIFFIRLKEKRKLNIALENSLNELKVTQKQLIQSEKMASLGALTAGIAHEIQNPLNFIKNFSELNRELLTELNEELQKGNLEEVNAISADVISNEEKINHHGKRADAIVKGMLQHSRRSSGVKEPIDLNALCDEYLRLSYHGLRAKDKGLNATIKTDFDDSIREINIIPQEFGRVILNLCSNAFYAVTEKKSLNLESYEPTVSISTKKEKNKITIIISDNGNGMPQDIIDKIFQPFFTTKPSGKGTGLGLSMSYDIITKGHNGKLLVESKENEGSVFIIILPI